MDSRRGIGADMDRLGAYAREAANIVGMSSHHASELHSTGGRDFVGGKHVET